MDTSLQFNRMLFLYKRLEARVLIAQPAHKAHRHAVLVKVVDETAAIHFSGQRPAYAVLDQARLDSALGQLPQLLETDAVGLRVAVGIQAVFFYDALGQMPTTAFAQHGDRSMNLYALHVAVLGIALAVDAHVANDNAPHLVVVVV